MQPEQASTTELQNTHLKAQEVDPAFVSDSRRENKVIGAVMRQDPALLRTHEVSLFASEKERFRSWVQKTPAEVRTRTYESVVSTFSLSISAEENQNHPTKLF